MTIQPSQLLAVPCSTCEPSRRTSDGDYDADDDDLKDIAAKQHSINHIKDNDDTANHPQCTRAGQRWQSHFFSNHTSRRHPASGGLGRRRTQAGNEHVAGDAYRCRRPGRRRLGGVTCRGPRWQTLAGNRPCVRCVRCNRSKSASPSIGVLLLRDIRTVFLDLQVSSIVSASLVTNLKEIEESPWAAISKGEPLKANGLSWRLKKDGIAPKTIRGADVQGLRPRPVRGRLEPLPGASGSGY